MRKTNRSKCTCQAGVCIPFVVILAMFFIISPTAPAAREGWEELYQDTFESGSLQNWQFDSGWELRNDDGNNVLAGSSNSWADLAVGSAWGDFSVSCSIKLISGGIHLNYRTNGYGRYMIGLYPEFMYLSKEGPPGQYEELENETVEDVLNTWIRVDVTGTGGTIAVSVNGELRMQYADPDPMSQGGIALETLDLTLAYFDNVTITGPPPPESPGGFAWTRTGGPSGGLGYDIRIHPSNKHIMYVTDNPSGVNKSTDAGLTWFQTNAGIVDRTGPSLDGVPIFSLTIDPSNPATVWAGTQNANGIYVSTDDGETWTKKVNGIRENNEISFRNFGIHPADSSIVFAGAEISTGVLGKEFDKTRGKIYRTTDAGENWQAVWEGDNLVRFVLFDYENPEVLYASTGIFDREAHNETGVGMLKSTDGGDTWFQINEGIVPEEGNLFFGFLEMDPRDPDILFAASGNNALGNGGVYRTSDGGQQWEQVLKDDIFTVVTFSPSNPDILYAGSAGAFYRSDDGGTSWARYSKASGGEWGPPGIRAGVPISAVVDPDEPDTLFANNYGGGNFKSTDGSETWVNASDGYTGAAVHWIDLHADKPGLVFAIGRSGPFRSTDGGGRWDGIGFSPANNAEWNTVAVKPDYSGQLMISDEHEASILRSTDWGTSWETVFVHPDGAVNNDNPQYARHGFKAFAYAQADPNIVYAGMRKGRRTIDGDFPPAPSFGMYKSTDSGSTWFSINDGLETSYMNINHIAVHPENADIAYIGTWRDGVFKTTDGGGSWSLKSNGLLSADVRCLAIDPGNPDTVYAGLGGGVGVCKSTNGGELWGEINRGIRIRCPGDLLPVGRTDPGVSLRAHPRRFAGADYYAVPWTSVRSIAIDPVDTEVVYAGDYNGGVYRSTDGGQNWLPINEGLSTRAVTSLAVSSDGTVLYAATDGEGVFRIGAPEPFSLTTPQESCCLVETLYGSDSAAAAAMREYRDRVLRACMPGRTIISVYYRLSPVLCRAVKKYEPAGDMLRGILDVGMHAGGL